MIENSGLAELVRRLLDSTDPFPSALEDRWLESRWLHAPDLEKQWEELAEAVGYVRFPEDGHPTKWNQR